MATKTTNWCKCYCLYPNPNHKYCNDFISIRQPGSCSHPGMCIRRGIFKQCEKCLNLQECETIRKIATLKNITFTCTDFKE